MNLEDLPPLRDALADHGLMAKKAFGQHFLLDLNITRKIARLAELPSGDRVIEIGTLISGPFAGRLLGDMGAEVIKIEPPGAPDPLRTWGQAELDGHHFFWTVHARNKKSATLNLREAVHLCELRSMPQGHPDYRLVAQEMWRRIEEVHPSLAACGLFVNRDTYRLGRLASEMKTEWKRAVGA